MTGGILGKVFSWPRIVAAHKASRLALALLIVLALAMITGFQPLYWLIYMVVGGIVLGYSWAWLQSRGLETHVDAISPHPQVGQTVHLRVAVREKRGLPRAGLRARLVGDFVSMAEEDFNLGPRGTVSWAVSGLCHRRGLNNVGSLAISSFDPSGLLSLECHVGQSQGVLVYPATTEISRTLAEGPSSGGEISERALLAGRSPSASMVRNYVPGDSLSRIHWPSTARLGQLMTKEFEGGGINDIWLFLDMQGAVQMGTGNDSTEEFSIKIAASLAKGLIEDGHAVGLVTQGDQFYRIAPSKEPEYMWAMLKVLALVRAQGHTPLPSLISQESEKLDPGAVAIVIAPWLGRGAESLFRFLVRRGIMVVPIFLDTDTFGRPTGPRQPSEARMEVMDQAAVVSRGDDFSTVLGNVLDRLANY